MNIKDKGKCFGIATFSSPVAGGLDIPPQDRISLSPLCGGVKEGLPSQRNWMLFEISRSHSRYLGGVDEITEQGNLGNSCPEACLT